MTESFLIYAMIGVFAFITGLIWYQGRITRRIRHTGIRTRGVIIENRENSGGGDPLNRSETLGGNINHPVIRFTIENGSEIVGEPLTPFTCQHEVKVPGYINIIYDPKQPYSFIIDPD